MNIYKPMEGKQMVAAKKAAPKKKSAPKASARSKATKPEAPQEPTSGFSVLAEAVGDALSQPVAEASVPTTPAAPTTATMERSQVNDRPKAEKTSHHRKNKPTSGIAALKFEAFAAKDVFQALDSCGYKFDDKERTQMRNLVVFTVKHAKTIATGGRVDKRQMDRTIALATKVAESLENRFYDLMNGALYYFDKGIKELEATAPEILVRDAEKIKKLDDDFRNILADANATYDATVKTYKAFTGYVPSVSAEIADRLEAERQRKRDERQRTDASEIDNEFADLADMFGVNV
jgi:hypothetical protein